MPHVVPSSQEEAQSAHHDLLLKLTFHMKVVADKVQQVEKDVKEIKTALQDHGINFLPSEESSVPVSVRAFAEGCNQEVARTGRTSLTEEHKSAFTPKDGAEGLNALRMKSAEGMQGLKALGMYGPSPALQNAEVAQFMLDAMVAGGTTEGTPGALGALGAQGATEADLLDQLQKLQCGEADSPLNDSFDMMNDFVSSLPGVRSVEAIEGRKATCVSPDDFTHISMPSTVPTEQQQKETAFMSQLLKQSLDDMTTSPDSHNSGTPVSVNELFSSAEKAKKFKF